MEKHSQLALSPLLRKSPSSGFSVSPVFSHILWISDMHSLGFRRKKSRPCRIVRLCWFQSHRFCRFWLLMAENAYMLKMKKKKRKKLQISQQIRENVSSLMEASEKQPPHIAPSVAVCDTSARDCLFDSLCAWQDMKQRHG